MDPVTVARLWMVIRPIKRLKERRAAKRAAKAASDAAGGEFFEDDQEVSMDVKAFAIQAVLAGLRHLMTASPFAAAAVTDDWLLQTATIIVGLGAFVWSLQRKVKPSA